MMMMMMMNYIHKVGNGNDDVQGSYSLTAVHLGYKNLGKISNGLIIFISWVNMNTMYMYVST